VSQLSTQQVPLEMSKLAACLRLSDELLGEGIDVALSVAARELGLVASVESSDDLRTSAWIPIKVVAVGADESIASLEDVETSGLVIALVCKSGRPEAVRAFAFTPAELVVVKMIAIIGRQSEPRSVQGVDSADTRERVLRDAIEPFAVSPGQWRKKLVAMLHDSSPPNDH
jgi:hypothetical protein